MTPQAALCVVDPHTHTHVFRDVILRKEKPPAATAATTNEQEKEIERECESEIACRVVHKFSKAISRRPTPVRVTNAFFLNVKI